MSAFSLFHSNNNKPNQTNLKRRKPAQKLNKPTKLGLQQQAAPTAPAAVTYDPLIAALIIGIEYTNYAAKGYMTRLPGCHNDSITMQKLLSDVFKVLPTNMLVLMDDGKHQSPIKSTIQHGFRWLANKAVESKCTQLWIIYSGHGSYLADTNGDEPDGNDEVLVPADCYDNGYIDDDYMKDYAIKQIPSFANLVCCFDCCHSGSILDLPYSFNSADSAVKQNVVSNTKWITATDTNGMGALNPLCLSACADTQTSVSAYNLNKAREWQGAFTYAFNFVVRQRWQEQLTAAASPENTSVTKFSISASDIINRVGRLIAAKGYDQTTSLSMATETTDAKSITFPI